MAKMRVHELAKELNIKSQDILDKLKNTKFDGELEDKATSIYKENYDLKHDLITADMKIESLEAQLQEAKDKNIELQKEIVKLQTELKNKK